MDSKANVLIQDRRLRHGCPGAITKNAIKQRDLITTNIQERAWYAPCLKSAMRTTQNFLNKGCVRPTVFVIRAEAKSPALPLLECAVPLA